MDRNVKWLNLLAALNELEGEESLLLNDNMLTGNNDSPYIEWGAVTQKWVIKNLDSDGN